MVVQIHSAAPIVDMRLWRNWQTRYFEGVVISGRMGSSPINRTIYFKETDIIYQLFLCSKMNLLTQFNMARWSSG